jgi:hypothetical protein
MNGDHTQQEKGNYTSSHKEGATDKTHLHQPVQN